MTRDSVTKLGSRLILALALALVIGTQFFHAWQAVSPFEGNFFDGPFQFYDALRRIDAGQMPGRDFPAFHGLGIPIIHYPAYRLLGGDLIAAELTRQLVTRLVAVVVYLLTSWLLTGRLWPGVFWLVVCLLPTRYLFGNLAPGNSMLTIRSLIPLLFVGVVYRCPLGWRGALLLGLTLSAAWMMGVEHFMALAAGTMVTGIGMLIVRWLRTKPFESPSILLAVVAGLVFAAGLTTLLAGDKLADVLRYYFVLLPGDQVWYFGVPPNHFIGDGR